MNNLAILKLESVTHKFSQSSIFTVAGISLTLHQGDILALLGPSGCGKTTLLRLIAGFEQPQAGTIHLSGQPVAGLVFATPPEKRNIGMVFQDYALFPHLTVAHNIAFGLQQRGGSPQELLKRVTEALALVGLKGMGDRYPHELSGGQQQRVALARALAPRPALLLLDEPLSNLDVQVRLHLRQEVRDILKATGTSGIFVTHDQEEALAIADQVAVMRQGCLEQWGTPEAIYHQPNSRFVAEFVTQANFLPAFQQGEFWQTEIGQFTAHGYNLVAKTGELMIRQEDLKLEPDAAGEVIVRDRQFLGREYYYRLQTASGQQLQARTTDRISIGRSVRCHVLDDQTLQVFPATSSLPDPSAELPLRPVHPRGSGSPDRI